MIKRVISVLLVCAITSILVSCEKKSEHSVTDMEMDLFHFSQEYFWNKLHDQNHLVNVLTKKIFEWRHITQETPFLLIDQTNQTDYQGALKLYDEWILEGKTMEGQDFILYNENDQVILEYGEQIEFFSEEEFQLLLPLHHFALIQELVEAENYEMVSWGQEEDGWSIHIQTKTDLLHDDFNKYLLSHFKEDQTRAVEKSLFQGYTLHYLLQFTGDFEKMSLQSLQTILEKDGLILENLLFHF